MADGPYPENCLDIYLIRFFSRKETCSCPLLHCFSRLCSGKRCVVVENGSSAGSETFMQVTSFFSFPVVTLFSDLRSFWLKFLL